MHELKQDELDAMSDKRIRELGAEVVALRASVVTAIRQSEVTAAMLRECLNVIGEAEISNKLGV